MVVNKQHGHSQRSFMHVAQTQIAKLFKVAAQNVLEHTMHH